MNEPTKMLLIADLHLRVNDPYGRKKSVRGLSARTEQKLASLESAVNLAIDQECTVFGILGDLFDQRVVPERLRVLVGHLLHKYLSNVEDGWVIYLGGNHDSFGDECSFQGEGIFESNIITAANPCVIDWLSVPLILLPDVGTAACEDYLRTIPQQDKESSILLGHFPLVGAWQNDTSCSVRGVHPDLLTGFPVALFGDFHRRQLLDGSDVTNHYRQTALSPNEGKPGAFLHGYVGSLCRNSFSEAEQPKGGVILTVQSRSDNPIDGYTYKAETFDVEDIAFVTIPISEDSIMQGVMDSCRDKTLDGAVVRLRGVGSREWFSRLPIGKLRAAVLESGAISCSCSVEYTDVPKAGGSGTEVSEIDLDLLTLVDDAAHAKNSTDPLYAEIGRRYIGDALAVIGE